MDFLGQCRKDSCGLLESSSGSGGTLTDNNKLLGPGDKNVGSVDATNLNFLTNNVIRATINQNGQMDVKELASSNVELLPNYQWSIISGNATLSNYESTITTASTDEFRTSKPFIPNDSISINVNTSDQVEFKSPGSGLFQCGVIDTLGNITLVPGGPHFHNPGDLVEISNIYLPGFGNLLNMLFNNGNSPGGNSTFLTTNLDVEHYFYITGLTGTSTIYNSIYKSQDNKASVNLADGHKHGLTIREETDQIDYINIDTEFNELTIRNLTDINDGNITLDSGGTELKLNNNLQLNGITNINTGDITLSNTELKLNNGLQLNGVTDINSSSIRFTDNVIEVNKELVGSTAKMLPNETIVNQSNFGSVTGGAGSILTFTADETLDITIPITPPFQINERFSFSIFIDKQNNTSTGFYIGIGEYGVVPLNYQLQPTSLYLNTQYITPTGYGGNPASRTLWNLERQSAPSYSNVGKYEIRVVGDENGDIQIFVEDTLKIRFTVVGSNTFEAFIYKPSQSVIGLDTHYNTALSDVGVIIDSYRVADNLDRLLPCDPANTSDLNIVKSEQIDLGEHDNVGYEIVRKPVFDVNLLNASPDPPDGEYIQVSGSGDYIFPSQDPSRAQAEIPMDWRQVDITIQALLGQRHFISIVDDLILSDTDIVVNSGFHYKASRFNGTLDYLIFQNGSEVERVSDTFPGDQKLDQGDIIRFTCDPVTDIIKLFISRAGGPFNEIVTNNAYTINRAVQHYIYVSDVTINVESLLAVTATYTLNTEDFAQKKGLTLYDGYNVNIEKDLKFEAPEGTIMQIDSTNNEIDFFRTIQSTKDISCRQLFYERPLFPFVTTAEMLAIVDPYRGQQVWLTDAAGLNNNLTSYDIPGDIRLCHFTGNTWQIQGQTIEAINQEPTVLIQGGVVEFIYFNTIAVNQDRRVKGLATNTSARALGVVAFQNSSVQGEYVTIAVSGYWSCAVQANNNYNSGNYLTSSTTNQLGVETANAGTQTYAQIVNPEIIGAVPSGFVLGYL